ncbi:MAG: NADH:flavin oxidoreductase [Deltaproteobacteria bacterium HGW-Deltaproteobacteria-12]|jgi:2,4-dienoyl-CoA reductase-like NADH-dependent reductase (Old Yellow Enzyme family)/thioredoxin reductase|nr:MAG: NADH:flavin oxidoreductase [Deltaproteobacteria bacterium HGW-Deltaproteobacteria-12]
MMGTLRNILSPLKIKSMEISNRVVMPPMGTNLGRKDGTVSDENIAYLTRRAQGKPGLIITEITGVHPDGVVGPNQIGAYDDRFIPGLKKMADAAHKEGCKIAMQIHHTGRESLYLLVKGRAMAPSPIPSIVFKGNPREMTLDEIQEMIICFGQAARRAREAGYDAVEIHGAHGYLLTQFLSAITNQRSDRYGGATLKERSRFVLEVIAEVRRQVGEDYPVSIRLSAQEFIKGGYSGDDMQTIIPDMVKAGADLIHASFGTHGSPGGITQATGEYAPGFNVWLAKKIKDVTAVPVIAVGRFTDPAAADEVIARGDADLVAFGRQFLADPDFLIKAGAGRTADIRQCIACNQGCIEREMLGEGNIRCSINPETGQETIYPEGPSAAPRNIWVVGSGPAGLIAASEACRLGHKVTLFEKKEILGGQIRYAQVPPHKEIYGQWIDWQIGQIEKSKVAIRKETEVTEVLLTDGKPDYVIVATGGEKMVPPITGINQPFVCDAWQILDGRVAPGKNVVVIGGGLIGMEVADFLSEKGVKVTLVEMLQRSPVLKITSHGYMLHNRLREKGCRLMFGVEVKTIGDACVECNADSEASTISPVDQVVIAVGMKPVNALQGVLEKLGIGFAVVGDARTPRRIIEAVEEGARAVWDLK